MAALPYLAGGGAGGGGQFLQFIHIPFYIYVYLYILYTYICFLLFYIIYIYIYIYWFVDSLIHWLKLLGSSYHFCSPHKRSCTGPGGVRELDMRHVSKSVRGDWPPVALRGPPFCAGASAPPRRSSGTHYSKLTKNDQQKHWKWTNIDKINE